MIVVDNGSSDGTVDTASDFTPRVYSKGPERGAQKNYGAGKSNGAFLLFIDSDMILQENVISDCVALSTRSDIVMIPEKTVGKGFWAACRALERSCYADDMWTGAARFFPKTVFDTLGGFDETLRASGDDLDLHQRARRAGYTVGVSASTIDHDEGVVSPWDTYKKWRYYGRNMSRYIRKNPREATMQYLPIRPAWIRHWRKLIKDPSHTAGFMVLKGCQLAGVLNGRLDILRGILETQPYNKSGA